MSMRARCAGFLSLCAAIAAPAAASAADCRGNPNALGTARVQEIDTGAGPKFGHQQYKDNDFLSDGEVVLTFDDGPARIYTQPIVNALEANCTRATFFMVGQRALQDTAMVRDIARRGHTIATHTWSHANLRQQSPMNARREIELGFSAVSQALGQPVAPFFRFPYLADTASMTGLLQSRQMGNFSIDIDSYDYRTQDPQAVHQRIMAELAEKRKGILLFHDIQPSTARALPGLLAALKARGFRIVHIQPKAPVVTLAEFDSAVRGGRTRQVAAAAPFDPPTPPPVSQRGFTGQGQFPRQQTPAYEPPPPVASAPQPPVYAQPGYYPPPVFEPAPAPRPPRVYRRQEPDWRELVFPR
jgi:peptidoglycan-N-acetylglucosamine deacetylase